MKLYGYEVPNAFGSFVIALTRPPRAGSVEARPVAKAISEPRSHLYDPNALNFPNAQGPIIRGNSNVTAGLGMIAYDHQPQWDRNAVTDAGPVREYVRRLMEDRRIKQT